MHKCDRSKVFQLTLECACTPSPTNKINKSKTVAFNQNNIVFKLEAIITVTNTTIIYM